MERVNTGGFTEIKYPKGHKSRPISEDEHQRFDNAWEKVRARRKRNKLLVWIAILAAILLLGIAGLYLL